MLFEDQQMEVSQTVQFPWKPPPRYHEQDNHTHSKVNYRQQDVVQIPFLYQMRKRIRIMNRQHQIYHQERSKDYLLAFRRRSDQMPGLRPGEDLLGLAVFWVLRLMNVRNGFWNLIR